MMGLLLICAAPACSAPALPPDYYKAEGLERQGRLEEALATYRSAADGCKKRPEACATTRMRVAQMQIRLGRKREAVETLLALERREGLGLEQGARAMGRAAALLASMGEWERAMALWWRLVDHYPESLAAEDALARIVARHKAKGKLPELVPLLRKRYQRLHLQDIGDNLLWEAARILERGDGRDKDLAVELYRQITRAFPEGGLRDNAWMAAARVRRSQGRFQDAILLYRELLDTREDAFGGASYHSEFLDDAHLEIGKIWLLDLGRPDRAIKALGELLDGLPTSTLRDDALFWISLAELERGREDRATKRFSDLKRRFPESRFRGEAGAFRLWISLRRAARAKDDEGACRLFRELQAKHPFSWLARRGPRPKPWPSSCAQGRAGASPRASRPGAASP
jgi:tetratricopeptide (TPR) repeat protein